MELETRKCRSVLESQFVVTAAASPSATARPLLGCDFLEIARLVPSRPFGQRRIKVI